MLKLTSKLTMFKLTDFFNLEKGLVFSQEKKRPLYLVNTNNDKSGRCLFFGVPLKVQNLVSRSVSEKRNPVLKN